MDVAVLYATLPVLGLYAGRLASYTSAVAATWWLNRHTTFSDMGSGKSKIREFGIYYLLMSFGGAVNYGCYSLMVSKLFTPGVEPFLGVAIGSLAGLVFNLVSSRYLLFRFKSD